MKNAKRLLVLILVASLCAGMFSIPAFAEEVRNEDGTTTDITTTTTTEVDPETGNTVVTVEIKKETSGTNNDGAVVTGEEKTVEKTITDKDGNKLGFSWVTDGSEKKEWTEQDTGDGEQPEVTVDLVPGGTAVVKGGVTTETTGDVPRGENDPRYDYTITTTTDRTVTAEASDVTAFMQTSEVELSTVAPEIYTDTKEVDGETVTVKRQERYEDGTLKIGIAERENFFDRWGYDIVEVVDSDGNVTYKLFDDGKEIGYMENWLGDYQFCGYGDATNDCKVKYNLVTIVYDDEQNPTTVSSAKEAATMQYVLKDKEGNLVYAYCADLKTPTRGGAFYNVANLEDSDYYASEESEEHIRAIVMNGYWGTSEGTGSLDKIKKDLKAALEADPTQNKNVEISVVGEDGSTTTKTVKLSELVDGLTEGEALTVTQAAIWSWANGSANEANNEEPGEWVIGVDGWTQGVYGNHDRMNALYTYLMGLTATAEENENNPDVVINDKNFVEDMSITIHDKVEGHENNTDDNQDNDVYNTDLNFKLAFVPDPESDDLLVYLTDADGNTINDKDGEPIVRRLAGTNSEGREADAIYPVDGVYTLTGLQLAENSDFKFDLRLEGTQYLENGVYIYSPIEGRDDSQTFVGMAEGTRNVDVSASMTIKFDVDEDNHVVAERKWHNEGDPGYPPDNDPPEDPPEDDPPGDPPADPPENDPPEDPPMTEIPPEDPPLTNIPDEEPPLANVPQTGDMTLVWFGISALSGLGLAGVNRFGKKKEDEEE